MIPRKFLVHTMSAITLTLALSTAGYAAGVPDAVYNPGAQLATVELAGTASEPGNTPTSTETNINTTTNPSQDTANIQTTSSTTDTTPADLPPAVVPTQGHAPYAAPVVKAASIETTPEKTDAQDSQQSSTSAPVSETANTNTTTNTSSTTETTNNDTKDTTPTTTTDNTSNSATNVTATPSNGHAPVNETLPETNTAAQVPTNTSTQTQTNTNTTPATQPTTNTQPATNTTTNKTPVVLIDPVNAPAPASQPMPVKGVSVVSYVVQKGDTLYLIAKRFVTTISEIKNLNNLKSDFLYVGQTLKVSTNSPGSSYTVQKGDTLYLISKKYGITIASLKSTNGLKSDALYVGQVLRIPTSGSTNYAAISVKKGDTLYLLAKKYGTSVSTLKSINGLRSDALYVGQVLRIPASTPAPATSSARLAAPTASRYSASRSEVLLLAKLIYGESRGESYEGQVAVGAVVLNRVKSSLFPNSIAGVIYQPNEFSAVLDGQVNLSPNATAMQAAEAALSGYDPTHGALYYWNPVKAPNNKFLNSKPIIARIGDHVFAK